MVKQILILVFILLFIGCMRVPIKRLNYLYNDNNISNYPLVKGCYYSISDTKSDSENGLFWIDYIVFYNSGLIRFGSYRENDTTTIENKVRLLLNKYKEQPSDWGDFRVVGNSIYIERITRVGMAPYEIYCKKGVIGNDSSIRIFDNTTNYWNNLDEKIYKFLQFKAMPDSTGYLYGILQSKRE